MRAVKLLRPHKTNNAGELCGFPDAEAAALVASGAALYHGPEIASASALEPSRDALLAGFAQRGIAVDPGASDADLRMQALSVMALEHAARETAEDADRHEEQAEGADEEPVEGADEEPVEGAEGEEESPAAKGDGQPATGRVGSPRRPRSAQE